MGGGVRGRKQYAVNAEDPVFPFAAHFFCIFCSKREGHYNIDTHYELKRKRIQCFVRLLVAISIGAYAIFQGINIQDDLNHPIWKEALVNPSEIPFPGLTICSTVHVDVIMGCTYKVHNDNDNGDHLNPDHGGDSELRNCSTFYYMRTRTGGRNGMVRRSISSKRALNNRPSMDGRGGGGSSSSSRRRNDGDAAVDAFGPGGGGEESTEEAPNGNGTHTVVDHCWEMNGDGAAVGASNGFMDVQLAWSIRDMKNLDDKHFMVNLFNPKNGNLTQKPAFYSWMAPSSFNYVLLSKAEDMYLSGKKDTKYTALPSTVPSTASDVFRSVSRFKFSYQNAYVVTRTQAQRYTWLMYLSALGGALSICDWGDRVLVWLMTMFIQRSYKRARNKVPRELLPVYDDDQLLLSSNSNSNSNSNINSTSSDDADLPISRSPSRRSSYTGDPRRSSSYSGRKADL